MSEYNCFTQQTNPLVGGTVTIDLCGVCGCKQTILLTAIKGDYVINFQMSHGGAFGVNIPMSELETIAFGHIFGIKLTTQTPSAEYKLFTSSADKGMNYFRWRTN